MRIIKIHRIIINHRENGLSIKNWARNIAIYDNWGHGTHGKIEPNIPVMQSMIHVVQHTMFIQINELF